jgi:hypothetical protein
MALRPPIARGLPVRDRVIVGRRESMHVAVHVEYRVISRSVLRHVHFDCCIIAESVACAASVGRSRVARCPQMSATLGNILERKDGAPTRACTPTQNAIEIRGPRLAPGCPGSRRPSIAGLKLDRGVSPRSSSGTTHGARSILNCLAMPSSESQLYCWMLAPFAQLLLFTSRHILLAAAKFAVSLATIW